MADRYWVGGTGTWDTVTTVHWSDTSGGASGATVPTAADNVHFDANSAPGNYTVTLTGTLLPCLDLNIAKATAGNIATTSTGSLSINGNVAITGTGVSLAGTGIWNYVATSGVKTITTSGISVPGQTFNGVGGTWQLQDDLSTNTTTQSVILTAGTLDLNNHNITCGTFNSSNSNVRVLAFGTGVINITGNSTTVFAYSIDTNLTVTGSATVNFTYAGATGTRTIGCGAPAAVATTGFNFNVSSGTDTVTISGGAGAVAKNLDFTGFSGTVTPMTAYIFNNLTFVSTNIVSPVGTLNIIGTSGTQVMTFAGKTPFVNINVNCPAATAQFVDQNITITGSFSLNAGTADLATHNNNISAGAMNSNSATARVMGWGSTTTVTITGTATTVYNYTNLTNYSYTGTQPTFYLTYSGGTGTRTLVGSNSGPIEASAPVLSFSNSATDIIAMTNGFATIDFGTFAGTLNGGARTFYGNVTFSASMTHASSGAVTTFAGTSGTTRLLTFNGRTIDYPITFNGVGGVWQFEDNFIGGATATTILALTNGTVRVNGKSITVQSFTSGSSSTRVLDFGTNGVINLANGGSSVTVWSLTTAANFSYTGTGVVNLTYSGGTGTRTINHATTSGGSEATKAPPFAITAGTDTLVVGSGSYISDLNFTGFTGTFTNTPRTIYGSLTLGTGMTLSSGTSLTTFAGTSGTKTITSNSNTMDFPITFDGVGGTWILGDALTVSSTRTLTLTNGAFNANNHNVTSGLFTSSNTNTRSITLGTGTVSLTGTGTVWNLGTVTNLTFSGASSNISLTDTTTTARTVALGESLTYGNLDIGGATGTSNTTFTGNSTFSGLLSSTKTVPHTVKFTAGTTTTVGGWTIRGTSGNIVTLTSPTAAKHNLVLTGGGNINTVDYLNISYSNASPSTDTWYAGGNSINSGNNTGWIFPAPVANSNFFLMF